jgi:hypothetical protein
MPRHVALRATSQTHAGPPPLRSGRLQDFGLGPDGQASAPQEPARRRVSEERRARRAAQVYAKSTQSSREESPDEVSGPQSGRSSKCGVLAESQNARFLVRESGCR